MAIDRASSECRPNEYCILTSPEHSSAVAKYDPQENSEPLLKPVKPLGRLSLNVEQSCAIDIPLRDDIKLVTLIGQAGTGKTLLALACGMRKVFDERTVFENPRQPPRSASWEGYRLSCLEQKKKSSSTGCSRFMITSIPLRLRRDGTSETLKWVMESKKIEMEAVTYIRGRSLPKMYIIIDEAQNLTPHEVKTIISRAGEGTKVILAGDPTQIDNPYLDKDSNGLTYTVGKFVDQKSMATSSWKRPSVPNWLPSPPKSSRCATEASPSKLLTE